MTMIGQIDQMGVTGLVRLQTIIKPLNGGMVINLGYTDKEGNSLGAWKTKLSVDHCIQNTMIMLPWFTI